MTNQTEAKTVVVKIEKIGENEVTLSHVFNTSGIVVGYTLERPQMGSWKACSYYTEYYKDAIDTIASWVKYAPR